AILKERGRTTPKAVGLGRRERLPSAETSSQDVTGASVEAGLSSRRTFLRGATGAAALVAGSGSAFARDQWWKDVFNDNRGGPSKPAARAKRQAAPLNDLRPGKIPWRSDEMLAAMDRAIEKYEDIALDGDWPQVPSGRLIRVGEYDDRVPLLRRRLAVSGELSARHAAAYRGSLEFDRYLDLAVRQFQEAHGLSVRGFLNRSTRAQLNITARERLGQLRLNRSRIARLVNGRIEDRYVLVNAAGYQLEAVHRFEVQQRHRVIVGKPDRQTPEIQATVLGLNFFPYWRVPKSIAVKDVVPRLRKEPDYLSKEHIMPRLGSYDGDAIDPETIDWNNFDPDRIKFRQEPGPWNALGLVRINMPNKEIVYLHDTPLKPLFKQRMRAFSAGCVRVEDVMELVAWIARYQPGFEQPLDTVEQIIDGQQPVDVKLNQPVPVYFTYITAWAEADGSVVFRPDVYGRDGSAALRGERDPDDPPPSFTLSP
ncbi:MAG: L,D-transpeptidase family protein, partial [Pseudomonadota bacterium]